MYKPRNNTPLKVNECPNHTLQNNLRHREKETQDTNSHMTS